MESYFEDRRRIDKALREVRAEKRTLGVRDLRGKRGNELNHALYILLEAREHNDTLIAAIRPAGYPIKS